MKLYVPVLFSLYAERGFFWFRVFGVGISGKDLSKHRLTFSERNGYKRQITVFGWSFAFVL